VVFCVVDMIVIGPTSATNELAVCWNHCFRKVVSYDMWLSRHGYSESQFLKFSVKHQKRG